MAGLVVGAIGLLIPLFFLVVAIFMIFAPMLDALMSAKEVAVNLANTAEKFTNLYKCKICVKYLVLSKYCAIIDLNDS